MNVTVGAIAFEQDSKTHTCIKDAIDRAVGNIAPAWPLESTVAVNPFVGQASKRLAEVSALHQKLIGIDTLQPADWYLEKITSGAISNQALEAALAKAPYQDKPQSVEALEDCLRKEQEDARKVPTLAELAMQATGIDWPTIIEDCIGRWAGGYFDRGGALWTAGTQSATAWQAWQFWASTDRTTEILGLTGFRKVIGDLPSDGMSAIEKIIATINAQHVGLEGQLHQALLSINGWAQHGRYLRWIAELDGRSDDTIVDLLAVRLSWDIALYQAFQSRIEAAWQGALVDLTKPNDPKAFDIAREIAQEAYERSLQDKLAKQLGGLDADASKDTLPSIQAAFCIDVRSEVFRRSMEAVSADITTLGFAGFFGLPVAHGPAHSALTEGRLPVLLNPGLQTCTHGKEDGGGIVDTLVHKATRPWHHVRTAALSSFAYVDAIGPKYVWQLAKRTLGLAGAKRNAGKSPKPVFKTDLDDGAKCDIAEKVLRAMSFTDGFAKTVLLAGHGANVTNNPHKSALHCGACGGHAGDVNARLLANLLNEQVVRDGIAERGIVIPDETVFVAGLHDTTTDSVMLYTADIDRPVDQTQLDRLSEVVAQAGALARTERQVRLPGAQSARDVIARAANWAETRPEWGLAGCKYFIAAPRSYSAHTCLAGESFLHDYDHRADQANDYPVLELILTAPVVVASWISLQYYASTVAPDLYGSGNKLLHNVVGGIGVYEGNGGQLRTGLPIQSVSSGDAFGHEAARLTVCIDAPTDAISDVLAKHADVRALFDNGWLHLLAFDETAKLSQRYVGNLGWESITKAGGI
jgi:uncharacterized protein YbcC (UPF0753/DUF2309 family)